MILVEDVQIGEIIPFLPTNSKYDVLKREHCATLSEPDYSDILLDDTYSTTNEEQLELDALRY